MREVLEETGLRIDPALLDDENMVTLQSGTRQVFYYLYLLDVATDGDDDAFALMRSKNSREVRDLQWFKLDGIPEPTARLNETRALFAQITHLLRRNCHDDAMRRQIRMKFISAATATATAIASYQQSVNSGSYPLKGPQGQMVGMGSTNGYTSQDHRGDAIGKEKITSSNAAAATAVATVPVSIPVTCPECGKWWGIKP